mmetsp:Transcript_9434/g.17796  ORF Transcript_9434/g.17796 Transcript_9434/m.17796 type:complete len:221 (-) Transcript_9434:3040-3702(-)
MMRLHRVNACAVRGLARRFGRGWSIGIGNKRFVASCRGVWGGPGVGHVRCLSSQGSSSGAGDQGQLQYSDEYLKDVLSDVKTIAMVGASTNWKRPSYFAFKYLQKKGYRVIPVNPSVAAKGEKILGENCYSSLEEIPFEYDMVDIFRNSKDAYGICEQAVQLKSKKGINTVWMQLGVRNDEAAALCEKNGINVVMDRCPKIEYSRLFGELGWHGFNSQGY